MGEGLLRLCQRRDNAGAVERAYNIMCPRYGTITTTTTSGGFDSGGKIFCDVWGGTGPSGEQCGAGPWQCHFSQVGGKTGTDIFDLKIGRPAIGQPFLFAWLGILLVLISTWRHVIHEQCVIWKEDFKVEI